ncbi:MAG: hypothetical protein EOO62_27815, partial [Hymenobacter sp.]
MSTLQLEIAYEQPVRIQLEFSLAVLASYRGASNLDEKWDDTILPIIGEALRNHQVRMKSCLLTGLSNSPKVADKLCCHLLLIGNPPLFDFNWLIEPLAAAGFQQGRGPKALERG